MNDPREPTARFLVNDVIARSWHTHFEYIWWHSGQIKLQTYVIRTGRANANAGRACAGNIPNSLYLKDRVDTVDQLGQHGECFLALRRMPFLLYMYILIKRGDQDTK